MSVSQWIFSRGIGLSHSCQVAVGRGSTGLREQTWKIEDWPDEAMAISKRVGNVCTSISSVKRTCWVHTRCFRGCPSPPDVLTLCGRPPQAERLAMLPRLVVSYLFPSTEINSKGRRRGGRNVICSLFVCLFTRVLKRGSCRCKRRCDRGRQKRKRYW